MSDSRASIGRPLPGLQASLEDTLNRVEAHLAGLGTALGSRDLNAIGHHAQELQHALTHAVDRFSLAARQGQVPDTLRRRLAAAGAQVAAQRESLARATAALDRAIDVLMPRQGPGCYARDGNADRGRLSGVIQA
jgi:ABC-type transporter Mla subunit MlaD